MLKIKILSTMNKYQEAQEVLADLLKWHPEHQEEVQARLEQVDHEQKTQEGKEQAIYKNMF